MAWSHTLATGTSLLPQIYLGFKIKTFPDYPNALVGVAPKRMSAPPKELMAFRHGLYRMH
jgi:hypothetical protein